MSKIDNDKDSSVWSTDWRTDSVYKAAAAALPKDCLQTLLSTNRQSET